MEPVTLLDCSGSGESDGGVRSEQALHGDAGGDNVRCSHELRLVDVIDDFVFFNDNFFSDEYHDVYFVYGIVYVVLHNIFFLYGVFFFLVVYLFFFLLVYLFFVGLFCFFFGGDNELGADGI